MPDISALLKHYFGYDKFRNGQKEIIENILNKKDVLGIMPTGAGKSICYQIPSLLLDGVTLVVSPLISLMKDQVDSLTQAGIPSAYINSSLDSVQLWDVVENARGGKYRLLYIAPERLETDGFFELIKSLHVAMIAIDEAHCVSQWGHDFRPSYTKIAQMAAMLPERPVMAAFTATATPQVSDDIIKLLKLENPFKLTTGFDRANLYFEVAKPKNKAEALLEYLERSPGKSGIIYASTRKTVDSLCKTLQDRNFTATKYHAGLSESSRTKNQDDFIYDRANIMVATNAFGMGIDKSNISFVIHYNMPKNIESYYQEAGRAGRDGEKADCILFFSAADIYTDRFLIDRGGDGADKASEYKKLGEMVDYCNTSKCLRAYILRYFGENTEIDDCGNCGNCLSDIESTDITIEAQKIMSCIKRMGERFGSGIVTNVLRGGKSKRIEELGFTNLSTYGIMKEYASDTVKELISSLAADGYIEFYGDKYPVLRLTQAAYDVLHGKKSVFIKRVIVKKEKTKSGGEKSYDEKLFEILRGLRAEIAAEENVPPFVIFSNASLADMCRIYPVGKDAMLDVSGVGEVKYERYGERFTAKIKDYVDENNITIPSTPVKAKKPAKKPSDGINASQKVTYELAQQGLDIEAIASRRCLAESTVCGHLLHCLQQGLPVDSQLFVTGEETAQIKNAIKEIGSDRLVPLKEALPDEISYNAIRYVLLTEKL